jgi:FkbM family methyltransferase
MISRLSKLGSQHKTKLRDIGRKAGLEIRLSGVNSRNDLRLAHFLKLFGVDLVLDVGANRGQFAQELFKAGYTGNAVSFEVLPDAYDTLREVAARSKWAWTVAPRVALSDRAGTAHFHVTEIDTASSLLSPTQALAASATQARLVHTIEVSTARLDDVMADIGLNASECFLKMDVQGSEALVMAGAPNALKVASGLMAEISLKPLYDGQSSAKSLLEVIYEAGFEVWDIWPGYRNPQTYRLLQSDVVCFKGSIISAAL